MKQLVWGTEYDDSECYFVGERTEGDLNLFKLCVCVNEEVAHEIAIALAARDGFPVVREDAADR